MKGPQVYLFLKGQIFNISGGMMLGRLVAIPKVSYFSGIGLGKVKYAYLDSFIICVLLA